MEKTKKNSTPGRLYGGETSAERLARQRQQFMDAGLELFGTVGYRATSVRLLCKQAQLTDRYFYKNFKDTEDLLAAVYSESVDQLQTTFMQAMSVSNLPADVMKNQKQLIEAGLRAFFSAVENPLIARVCWLEVLGVSPRIDQLYTKRLQQFAGLMLILARGMNVTWPLSEDESRFMGVALIGAISQSAMHWLIEDYQTPKEVLVSTNSRLIIGLIGALETPRTE